MPQSKEVHKEYMRKRREGSQEGSQNSVVHKKGSHEITLDTKKMATLSLICHALDKSCDVMDYSTGEFKRGNMLDLVRYGIYGPTMREVKAKIT